MKNDGNKADSFNLKLQQLKSFKYKMVPSGHAKNAEELFNDIIREQYDHKDAIIKLHNNLMNYVNMESATFFIRAHGSYKKNDYDLLRRGFLSEYTNGVAYSFCDNTFGMFFGLMKLFGTSFNEVEMNDYFKQQYVTCGFAQSSKEKELAAFKPAGAFITRLNSQWGWYLAHIHGVGANYADINFKDERNNYFPGGARSEWDNENRKRYIERKPSPDELALLKAHFIRFTHPLNNFLVPKKSCVIYNGANIGEEPELINMVAEYLKQAFEKEYSEMLSIIHPMELPKSVRGPIADVNFGFNINPKAKKEVKNNQPLEPKIPSEPKRILQNKGSIENLNRKLQTIGKRTFLEFYQLFDEDVFDKQDIETKMKHLQNWNDNSISTKISTYKFVVNNQLVEDALDLISKSKISKLANLAEKLLDMYVSRTEEDSQIDITEDDGRDNEKTDGDQERNENNE